MKAVKREKEAALGQFAFSTADVESVQALTDLRKGDLVVFTKRYPETAYASGLHRLGRFIAIEGDLARIGFKDCEILTSAPAESFLRYNGADSGLSLWGGRFPFFFRPYKRKPFEAEAS